MIPHDSLEPDCSGQAAVECRICFRRLVPRLRIVGSGPRWVCAYCLGPINAPGAAAMLGNPCGSKGSP
jgi:hypothetical protein